MNLPWPTLGGADLLRKVVTTIGQAWGVEHDPDGRHHWRTQDVTFDATRFTGDGTITWTVGSSDVVYERYARLGNLLVWKVYLQNTSTGGAGSTQLRIRVPGGLQIRPFVTALGYVVDAGTATTGLVQYYDDVQVAIQRSDNGNWSAAAANNTTIAFTVIAELL